METMRRRPPDRFLTDDEVIEFPIRGNDTPFRIRIWQGAGHCPFVVVSQVISPDGVWPGPGLLTLKLANFVNSAMLAYSSYGMLYLEDELDRNGVPTLTCYSFDFYGASDRQRLHNPKQQVRSWDFVEHVLRQKVDRWP